MLEKGIEPTSTHLESPAGQSRLELEQHNPADCNGKEQQE
jgi:hypothetical protein